MKNLKFTDPISRFPPHQQALPLSQLSWLSCCLTLSIPCRVRSGSIPWLRMVVRCPSSIQVLTSP